MNSHHIRVLRDSRDEENQRNRNQAIDYCRKNQRMNGVNSNHIEQPPCSGRRDDHSVELARLL